MMMPRFQQRSESRDLLTQVRPPPQPRLPRAPCAGGSARPPDAPAPPPAPGGPGPPSRRRRPAPAPDPAFLETAGRPAAGFAASRRGSGGNTPDATAGGPTGRPSGSGTGRAESRSGPEAPASQPRSGRRGGDAVTCRGLGRSCRRRSPGNRGSDTEVGEPDGLVTAPSVHRARAHAGVDVRGPPSPPRSLSSPPGAPLSPQRRKRTVAEAVHRHQ